MNRTKYFDYIEEKLSVLTTRINLRGRLNVLDVHLHSENFYLHFFNTLYGWKLENLNSTLQNVEAIDLIDHTNKCIVQVSATNTKAKIESALCKNIMSTYPGYSFKFISISKDAADLRKLTFSNPHNLTFVPATDIYDTLSILNYVLPLKTEEQQTVCDFIKKELGNEIDFTKLDTNLAAIINILTKENLNTKDSIQSINSFEIDRKISYNKLDSAKAIIEDYRIHYGRVDKIYQEFDTQGANKSISVLNKIRNEYLKAKNDLSDDKLFFEIVENVQQTIVGSTNYTKIPVDELELCVNILVVDSFIRCKIFENPENYNYASARKHTSRK